MTRVVIPRLHLFVIPRLIFSVILRLALFVILNAVKNLSFRCFAYAQHDIGGLSF